MLINGFEFDLVYLAAILRILNTALLIYLTNFYFRSYGRIKSNFNLGLLTFSVLLLLNNVFAIYFRLLSGVEYGDEISLHNFVLNLVQLGGLVSLVSITRK